MSNERFRFRAWDESEYHYSEVEIIGNIHDKEAGNEN